MRCICLGIFTLLTSCIYHLMVNNMTFTGGMEIVSVLWKGGISGTSGGLICGLVAMILRWACGTLLSYTVFILAAVLTLLAAMKITVASIIRAIQNRPRDDWDEDEFVVEKPEPAAMVVNHIANKRIEHKRAKRMNVYQDPVEQYFDEEDGKGFDYAYRYPGMNKVLQSAGRVIRTAEDVGIVILLDERFEQLQYMRMFPREWEEHEKVSLVTIGRRVERFWDEWL